MDEPHSDERHEPAYKPTTTHAEWGAGSPHLRITRDDDRTEFPLDADIVRIGSAAGNELILADTDSVHATITHDEHDEYVLVLHGAGEMSASAGVAATHGEDRTATLRTGSRFTLGPWELVFARAEFADHGRPYGGRAGGEGAHQTRQGPRPDYSGHAAAPILGAGLPTGMDAGADDLPAEPLI